MNAVRLLSEIDQQRRQARGATRLALLLFPLFGIFYYTTLAFHLSVLSIWVALHGSWRSCFVAGLGVSAVALCKQPIGAALALFMARAETKTAVFCDRETSRCPRTVLVKGRMNVTRSPVRFRLG